MHVHGFPNMFVLGHAQGGFTANYPHLLEEASTHVAHIIRHVLDDDIRQVEATEAAVDEWLEVLDREARDMRAFQESCTPGYYNNEGAPQQGAGLIGASYGKGPMAFFRLLADWRDAGDFAGLDFRD